MNESCNGNNHAFVPIGHAVKMKETYKNMKTILDRVKYAKYESVICGNLEDLVHVPWKTE